MPQPISISISPDHADDILNRLAAPSSAYSPIPVHPLAAGSRVIMPTPPHPATQTQEAAPMPRSLAPISPSPPPSSLTSLPTVNLGAPQTSFFRRVGVPVLEALGTTFAPQAMPMIPGTPQHQAMLQALGARQAQEQIQQQLAQGGMGTQEAALEKGQAGEAGAQAALLRQQARSGMGTAEAQVEQAKAKQALLNLGVSQGVVNKLSAPGAILGPPLPAPGSGPGPIVKSSQPVENGTFNIPNMNMTGQVSDQDINQMTAAGRNLATAAGFVPQLQPLANAINENAGRESSLASAQNMFRLGTNDPQVALAGFNNYQAMLRAGAPAGTQTMTAAMLQARQEVATASSPTTQTTNQAIQQTPSGLVKATTTTTKGPGGGVGSSVSPNQPPPSNQTSMLTGPDNLPIPPKADATEVREIDGIKNVMGMMQELQPVISNLEKQPNPNWMNTNVRKFLYNYGFQQPGGWDKYMQLTGLASGVGAMTLGTGGSRSITFLQQLMQHLASGNAPPAESGQRIQELLNVTYPAILTNAYETTYKGAAGTAAAQDKVKLNMPDIGYWAYWLTPDHQVIRRVEVNNGDQHYFVNPDTGKVIR